MIRPPTVPVKSCTSRSLAIPNARRFRASSMLSPSSFGPVPYTTAAAVKIVAAGLDDGIDQQAAPRHLRVAAHRLHARPVDRVVVDVAALIAVGLGRGRQHPFEHLPRLAIWPYSRNCTVSPNPDEPTSRFVRTPGTWFMKEWNPSREVGSTSSCSLVSSVEVAVDVVSTNGEAPETVIVSDTAPDVHLRVHSRREPDRQPHALAPDVLKAGELEEDRVDADGSGDRRYSPRSSVTLGH